MIIEIIHNPARLLISSKLHSNIVYKYVLQSNARFWRELYVIQSTRNNELLLDAEHLCNLILFW
jgi:hypothetical protein